MEPTCRQFPEARAVVARSLVVRLAAAPCAAWERAFGSSRFVRAVGERWRAYEGAPGAERLRLAGIALIAGGAADILLMATVPAQAAPLLPYAWGAVAIGLGAGVTRWATSIDAAWSRALADRQARAIAVPSAVPADPSAPFSVVVPVYNEAAILAQSLERMVRAFDAVEREYEILICENGSTDDTRELARQVEQLHRPVRADFLPTANYGLALKHGIERASHDIIAIVNIDFWNVDFLTRAIPLLVDGADLVIGSKVMKGASDERPILRRAITRSFNALLRFMFGFRGTDTHGLKALRRSRLLPIAERCVTDRSLFDTELVLRAERAGLTIVEVPVDVREIRMPDYGSVVRRIPEAVWNLVRLAFELYRS